MPAAVEDTDVAVTSPSLAFEPWTTTVSPTCSAAKLDFAFRLTVAKGPTITFTRLPLELVTYRVEPVTEVTVPVVAPPSPEAPVVPLRPKAANDVAADEVDVEPWLRWSAAPPHSPPAPFGHDVAFRSYS
jgi:hypothetical protein